MIRKKILTTALLAGFISMGANAGFEQFAPVTGEANVFRATAGGNAGDYWFYSGWAVPDLQALTTDDRTFELLPNINAYADNPNNSDWRNNGGAGPDGNAWMDTTAFFRANPIQANMTNASFSFTVDANTLSNRYEVIAFVRVRETSGDWLTVREDTMTLSSTGSFTLETDILPGNTTGNHTCDAGFTMSGLNANPADDWGSLTVTATELSIGLNDVNPPTPSPMTFASAPAATSDQSISMTATIATDDVAGVEYNFVNTAGGGHDSGWQTSETYTDTGLAPNTLYSYTVTARDTSNQNEGIASPAASATTNPTDNDLPSPSPMTFAATPEVSTVTSIMTATAATDASAVEYNFVSTAGGGPDSGWQSSPIYIAKDLTPGSNYTYSVTARDLSAATNTTLPSVGVSFTTSPADAWMVNSLKGYTGDTDVMGTLFALELDSLGYGTPSSTAAISFDGSGATFGEGTDYLGRNILRTIALDFDDVSFEAYATFVFDGTDDQAAFMGLGNGIINADVSGNWGVPELALGGVNGVVAEIKTSLSNGDPVGCNLLKVNDGSTVTNYFSDPIVDDDTFRVKLAYDADANEATLSVDTGYTGGAFAADRVLGTVDTSGAGGTNMWYGSPVRIYVGGGEGTVVSDLLIVNLNPAPVTVDIASAGGGAVISWEGEAAQTYDVQYKTDLVANPTWTTDPSSGCSDIYATGNGTISATSTVSGAANFYQVISQ